MSFFRPGKKPEPPKKPATLQEYGGIIEAVLKNRKLEPEKIRKPLDNGYNWSFSQGSITVQLYLLEADGRRYLQIFAPIIYLPQSNLLALYRHLLERNLKLTNASIGVNQDVVYLFFERMLDGLDPGEADEIINSIASYGDELDDSLLKEFGGRRYSQI